VIFLVYFERTPSTKSEYYFELKDGQACFLSDDGIFFFSVLPNFARRVILYIPALIGLTLLVLLLLNEYTGVVSPWYTPDFLFLLPWVLLLVSYATGRILSYGRSKKFSGRSLEELLINAHQNHLRSRRDWSEVKRAELREYNITLKWYSSTFPIDRGLRMSFVWNYYPSLKSFLTAKVNGRFVEKKGLL
jgi:hypothetical protein